MKADIHCVTKWSKLDTVWHGVSVDTLLAEAATRGVHPAPYVLAVSDGGYTTNLPLADVIGGKAWVAVTFDEGRLVALPSDVWPEPAITSDHWQPPAVQRLKVRQLERRHHHHHHTPREATNFATEFLRCPQARLSFRGHPSSTGAPRVVSKPEVLPLRRTKEGGRRVLPN